MVTMTVLILIGFLHSPTQPLKVDKGGDTQILVVEPRRIVLPDSYKQSKSKS